MDRALCMVCGISAAVLATACAGTDVAAGGRGPQPEDLAHRAGSQPATQVPRYSMDPDLPAWHFAEVPGWLASTVQPATRRQNWWTPAHPNATAVILNADAWSEAVEEGTRFRLVVAEGNLPLTLSEVSQIPYGCDDIPTTMAAFRTPHDLAEQLAWILPESFADARALAIRADAAHARERVYSVAGLVVRLVVSSADRGELRIERNGQVAYRQAFEKLAMEGASDDPLSLDTEWEIGVPYPQAGFQFDPANPFLVLRTHSYEGVHFEVIRLGSVVASAGTTSLYLCAF